MDAGTLTIRLEADDSLLLEQIRQTAKLAEKKMSKAFAASKQAADDYYKSLNLIENRMAAAVDVDYEIVREKQKQTAAILKNKRLMQEYTQEMKFAVELEEELLKRTEKSIELARKELQLMAEDAKKQADILTSNRSSLEVERTRLKVEMEEAALRASKSRSLKEDISQEVRELNIAKERLRVFEGTYAQAVSQEKVAQQNVSAIERVVELYKDEKKVQEELLEIAKKRYSLEDIDNPKAVTPKQLSTLESEWRNQQIAEKINVDEARKETERIKERAALEARLARINAEERAERLRYLHRIAKDNEINLWNTIKEQSLKFAVGLPQEILQATMRAVSQAIQFGLQEIRKSIQEFLKYDQQLAMATGIFGASPEELAPLEEDVREIGRTTTATPEQALQTATAYGRNGLTVDETRAALRPTVLAATSFDVDGGRIGEALGATLIGFNKDAEESTRILDMFSYAANESALSMENLLSFTERASGVSESLNQTLEDQIAFAMAAANSGIREGETITIIYSNIADSLQKHADKFEQLGIQVYDSAGNFRPVIDILTELQDKLNGLNDAQQKLVLEGITPDQRTQRYLRQVMSDIGNARGYSNELTNNSPGSLEKQAETVMAAVSGQFDLMNSAIEELRLNLSTALAPAQIAVYNFAEEFFSALAENTDLFESLTAIAEEFALLLKENPGFIEWLAQETATLIEGVFSTLLTLAQRTAEFLEKNPSVVQDMTRAMRDFGSGIAFVVDHADTLLKILTSVFRQAERIVNIMTSNYVTDAAIKLADAAGLLDSGERNPNASTNGTTPFSGIIVTSPRDASGEPGFDYVVSDGQRGAEFGSLTQGTVVETVTDQNGATTGYGNQIIIRTVDPVTGEEVDLLYAHMDDVLVNPGDAVDIGTILGTQGRTGRTTGPHVSVDFFGPGSSSTTDAALAMRDRLAAELQAGASNLNSIIAGRQPSTSARTSSVTSLAESVVNNMADRAGPIPRPGTVGTAERVQSDPAGAQAILDAAQRLQLDPVQLAALMSFESAGTLNPNVWGGDGGEYKGLIQFSPDNQRRYGTGSNQSIAQQMPAIVDYLLDTGFTPGEHDIRNAYGAILAGDPYNMTAQDSNGTSVNNAHAYFTQGDHYDRAVQFLADSGVDLSNVSSRSFNPNDPYGEIAAQRAEEEERLAREAEQKAAELRRLQDDALASERQLEDARLEQERRARDIKLENLEAQFSENDALRTTIGLLRERYQVTDNYADQLREYDRTIADLTKKNEDLAADPEFAENASARDAAIAANQKLIEQYKAQRAEVQSLMDMELDSLHQRAMATIELTERNRELEMAQYRAQQAVTKSQLETQAAIAQLSLEDSFATSLMGVDAAIADIQAQANLATLGLTQTLDELTRTRDEFLASLGNLSAEDVAALGGLDAALLQQMDNQIADTQERINDINDNAGLQIDVAEVDRQRLLRDQERARQAELNTSGDTLADMQLDMVERESGTWVANIERRAEAEERIKRDLYLQLQQYREAGLLTDELEANLRAIAEMQIDGLADQFKTLGDTIDDVLNNSFKDFFQSVISGNESLLDSFKNLISGIAAQFAELAVNQIWTDLFGAGLNLFGGGNASVGASSMILDAASIAPASSSSFGDNLSVAAGTAFNILGSIPMFANGGLVDKPTLAMIGEGAYSEAVVPLPDGRSIPVQMRGGVGGGVNSVVNVTVNSDGSARFDRTKSNVMSKELETAVLGVIAKHTRPGNRLGR